MTIAEQCEKMVGILESLGYDCDSINSAAGVEILLTDPTTQGVVDVLVTNATASLLSFLALAGKLKTVTEKTRLDDLERRVDALEKQAEAMERTEGAEQPALPTLDELRVRATAIGTSISEDGSCYFRPRFIVPGTKAFYFTVKNALEPNREHTPYGGMHYHFQEHEYPRLVKWVEHDEEIYAKLNKKHKIEK